MTVLVTAGLCLALQDGKGQPPPGPKVKINGLVMSSKGTPLQGIDVTIWAAGKADAVATTKTQADGSYQFHLNLTGTYDIAYMHSKHDLAVVSRLFESKDQHINKVLYAKGEARPATALHEHLQSLERAAFLALMLERRDRLLFLLKIAEPKTVAGDLMRQPELTDPQPPTSGRDFLKQKADSVRALYMNLAN